MIRVAILAYEGVALFELGCATELFGLSRPEFDTWYNTDVVCLQPLPVTSVCGVRLGCTAVTGLDDYDLLVVPSWPNIEHELPKIYLEEVNRFYSEGKRLISFCSGAFLLAEIGCLEGRRATTHWRYAEIFRARFPHLNYASDSLYFYDGRIGCSAGSSAAIDLGLEVIRHDFGYEAANSVARRLVLSAHRKGGQSQFAEKPVQLDASKFTSALDWACKNLSAAIDINDLAARANMSRRTFDRKFRGNFNLSPKQWLILQRLNLAKELLEKKDLSVEKIAELSGFDNATTMRHHFRKELGISPSTHREHFAAQGAIN